MGFNWDTEEQHSRDDALEKAGERQQFGRRAVWMAALVAAITVMGVGLWSVAQRRANEVQAQVEADALAGHNLAARAAADGDEELFLNLITKDDEAWNEAQEELLEAGLLYEGAARFYEMAPAASSEVSQTVALDPELHVATVQVEQPFVTAVRAGVTQTVRLRQTHVYVQRNGAWQLLPPPSEFWSRQWRLKGEMVHVTYHMRDEAVALRLQNLLEDTLPEMCALPGLECPADLHVQVRLEPNPNTLVEANRPSAVIEGSNDVVLPSPTLVGTPVDEEGLELVAQAYAAQVVGPLISHVAGYECCQQGLFVRAVMERQLHHLGLRPWPLGPDEYERLLDVGVGDIDAYGLTSSTLLHILQRPFYRDTWLRVLSLVEMHEASLSGKGLFSQLGDLPDYWLIEEHGSTEEFVMNWMDFVYERSRSGQMAAPPHPLPEGDIRLVCVPSQSQATGTSEAVVWHYDPQSAEWSRELVHDSEGRWQTSYVSILPGDFGYLIQERDRDAAGVGVASRVLWQHGEEQQVLLEERVQNGGARLSVHYGGSSPGGRYPVIVENQYETGGVSRQAWSLLDLETCAQGECDAVSVNGYPKWSPDESRTILVGNPEEVDPNIGLRPPAPLHLAGPKGQNPVRVGSGYEPFWLNNEHYGYLHPLNGGQQVEIIVGDASSGQRRLLATTSDFIQILKQQEEPAQPVSTLQIERVLPDPANPHRILIQAFVPPRQDQPEPRGYLLAVELSADFEHVEEIKIRFRANERFFVRIAPQQSWAMLSSSSMDQWVIIDLESGERLSQSRLAGSIEWSPDGAWLVELHEHYLLLRAVGSDYKRLVARDSIGCHTVYWQ